jgi:hypothetical protein
MVSDFISLLLQAIGGAIASVANDQTTSNTGRYIMIAGLAFQVLSLAVFMLLWLDFLLRLRRTGGTGTSEQKLGTLRTSFQFKAFQYGMSSPNSSPGNCSSGTNYGR